MKISIRIDKPAWDPNPGKTQCENWAWRKCVIVKFQNQTFEWLPTYKQMEDIMNALKGCEVLNKEACKEYYKKKDEELNTKHEKKGAAIRQETL